MTTYANVEKKGGNQYLVTIGKKSEIVDLDGYTVMGDDDYNEVEKAGLIQDDMWCPSMWNITGDNDKFFKVALAFAANYSGFIAKKYIEENKD